MKTTLLVLLLCTASFANNVNVDLKKIRTDIVKGMRELIQAETPEKKKAYEAAIARAEKISDVNASIQALTTVQAVIVEDLINSYPNDLDAQLAFVIAQRKIAMTMGMQKGREEEAKKIVDRSLSHADALIVRNPKSGKPHLLKGALYSMGQQTKFAVAEIERCLALEPGNTQCKQMLTQLTPPSAKK